MEFHGLVATEQSVDLYKRALSDLKVEVEQQVILGAVETEAPDADLR